MTLALTFFIELFELLVKHVKSYSFQGSRNIEEKHLPNQIAILFYLLKQSLTLKNQNIDAISHASVSLSSLIP